MARPSDIGPPQQETRAPRLDDFDWQHLERLTEALLAHEPGVVTASQYGTSRQTQFGIDTKAELRGGGCDVASCKAYDRIGRDQLRRWSSDFLDHWDSHWKTKGVGRFVLVTTAPVASTRIVEDADAERERFKALGLGYELWGQPQLIERMRPHRGIVAQFVGTLWVDIICGPQQREALQPTGASVGIRPVGAGQVAELRALLSGEAEQRVARALDDLRAGDVSAVERTLADLRAEPLWSRLEPGAQARVLRFAASAALHRGDLDEAAALDHRAAAIQPSAEPRVAARIAMERHGAKAGLEVLGVPSTRDGRQLQVALRLSSGDVEGAEAVLAVLAAEGPDPETTRLEAWVRLMRDERGKALALAERLEREAGHWTATVRTVAVARYAAALSPMLAPEWFLNASPVDLDLVREDDEARGWLIRATGTLQALADRGGDRKDRHWLLAALSNQRDRRDDAQGLARTLLEEDPGDPIAVAWSLSRRFDVDLAESRRVYAARYEAGATEQIDVRIYALLLASDGEPQSVLAAHLDAQTGEARTEAETWVARFSSEGAAGGPDVRIPPTDVLPDAIQAARGDGDWSGVRQTFDTLAVGRQPQTLAAAQLIAAEGQWAILLPHRDAILAFGTAEAVRIVAYLVASTGAEGELVEFVERYRSSFRGGEPPPDVRRLIVDRQRRAGDLLGALANAAALSAQSRAVEDRNLEAELRASIGDTGGAARIVRDLLGSADLPPEAALRWGAALRSSDMPLARELWRFAVGRDEQRRLSVSAYFQAFSLGLEAEAAPLFPDVSRAAAEGGPLVRTHHVDELPDLIASWTASAEDHWALYFDCRIPAHLLAEHQNLGLDALLLPPPGGERGAMRLRLLRNGARPRHLRVGLPWSQWRLYMDVSALLVAADADLLDVIERQPNKVRISSALPAALIDMHRRAGPGQPARLAVLRGIVDLVGSGLVARERGVHDLVLGQRNPEDGVSADMDVCQLIDAAFEAGVLDEAAALRARAAAPPPAEGLDGTSARPAAGAALWLEGPAAERLFELGVLPSLCVGFDVGIDPDAVSAARHHVATEDGKTGRAAFLDALRERVRLGIEAGRFELIRRHHEREAELDGMDAGNPATRCLMDALIAEEVEGAVTWFEDRNLTGYPANRHQVIVELVDVLDALLSDGVLSEADVRARLSRLLGRGAGLIQLEATDVVPAVLAAPVVDGALLETPALAAIRRNRAAHRLMDPRLLVGAGLDPDDHRPDEMRLMLGDMKLAEHGLAAIWSDPSQTVETCVARSEWVWRVLRIERSLRVIPESEPGEAARNLATICFHSAVETLSLPTDVPLGLRRQRRLAFAEWFWSAALAPRRQGDPGILDRIALHIERLYLPLLTGRDRGRGRPGLELSLVRLRVAALPQPLIGALAPLRIGPHLGMRSDEIVTIRGARFEADRFWRAVRAARRYGPTSVRTVEGRRCRIIRTDDGVGLSGAVRARLSDSLCGVFDAGRDPIDRFEELIGPLELAPRDLATSLAQGREARTPNRLVGALVAARRRSAPAVYSALDAAFRPELRIALGSFYPPPAGALLHYLRLEAGDRPFTARLQEAAARLVAEVGAAEAVRRLDGLPTAGLIELAGVGLSPEARAQLDRTVTPVPAFHRAQVALSDAADDETRRSIVRDLVARFRHGAPPLVAILGWTARAFWEDPEYRALGAADRLALMWVHADRVLDTFLRRRADPDLLTRFFTEGRFEERLVDRLNVARFVDRDAASSTAMSSEALLFHALAALIGDRPLASCLDGAGLEATAPELRVDGPDGPAPAPALILRNVEGQNLLGSFLTAHAAELDALLADPVAKREALGREAMRGVEANRDDVLSWTVLMQHARTGLPPAQEAEAVALLRACDLAGLPIGARDGIPLARVVIRTMGLLLPAEERGRALEVVRAVARSAASAGASTALTGDDAPGGTIDPVHELLEICGCYAGIDEAGVFERFEAAMVAAAEEWPAAVPSLRLMVDRLIRSNGVIDAVALWRLHLHLNACP